MVEIPVMSKIQKIFLIHKRMAPHFNTLNLTIDKSPVRRSEPYLQKTKIFIYESNVSVFKDMVNGFKKPYRKYRKDVLPKILQTIEKKFPDVYELIKDEKWAWRQKCGCKCTCSPGFIGKLDNRINIVVTI